MLKECVLHIIHVSLRLVLAVTYDCHKSYNNILRSGLSVVLYLHHYSIIIYSRQYKLFIQIDHPTTYLIIYN